MNACSDRIVGTGITYKTYNLTGKAIRIKLNNAWDHFLYHDVWLPAHVVAEYKKFLIVEIDPHVNPNQSLGVSHPYQIGVNKMDIHFGDVEIREDNE